MHDTLLQILARIRSDADYRNSSNFVEDGLLDSFDMVMLTSELEKTYSITIDGLDFVPENFATLDDIRRLLAKNGASL
ncbi:MAG UNVERIFIED_CONTAM: acyl carrier protein [Planctomycetaceae bacterium]|jgi:acyl carrier protein